MQSLRSYILSIVASSIICACVQVLIGKKGTSAKLIRMVCGIYMAIVFVTPLHKIDFSIYTDYFSGIMHQAEDAVSEGQNIAQQKRKEIIIRQTQSYILDKASSFGVDVEVAVTVSDDATQAPNAITIKGAVSPYVKKMLTNYIEEQIGIPKEAQTWK